MFTCVVCGEECPDDELSYSADTCWTCADITDLDEESDDDE